MDRLEAEDYIYRSYLKAQNNWAYNTPDSVRRNPGLTHALLKKLSHTPSIVVTGSKGKGSVAAMCASILSQRMKTGLLTSPHISDFRERIRIDGQMIDEADFIRYVSELKLIFDPIEAELTSGECISPIGIQAAIALSYFNDRHTDFNVLECGKGARFDDVNNVTHRFAVINPIFLEHTRELGPTLLDIADDKSHVITSDVECVFVARQRPEVLCAIEERCKKQSAEMQVYDHDFYSCNIRYGRTGMTFDTIVKEKRYEKLHIPILGGFQAGNAAIAVAVCSRILPTLTEEEIRAGLCDISRPGRIQILSSSPLVMLDACINAESTRDIIDCIEYIGVRKITLVAGIPDDKDYAGVINALKGYADKIILTRADNPHYKFTDVQQSVLRNMGIEVELTTTVEEALDKVIAIGQDTVILGTTSLISEIIEKYVNKI